MQLFCSYAHKDKNLRDRLEIHLSVLKHEGVISYWHDGCIGAGADWRPAVEGHLNSADIILLLLSADFFDSIYCRHEMTRAMERHHEGSARVIPIILRPCDWRNSPCASLQYLPTGGKPIVLWTDRDQAFQNITEGIREATSALKPQLSHDRLPADAQDATKESIKDADWMIGSVLIGDPDLRRFERLNDIIKDTFGLRAIQANTFLQIVELCQASVGKLRLVLFTERLPYSGQERSVLLKACLEQFIGVRLGTGSAARVGFVYDQESLLEDISDDECDFFLPFPNSEEAHKTFIESLNPILGPSSYRDLNALW